MGNQLCWQSEEGGEEGVPQTGSGKECDAILPEQLPTSIILKPSGMSMPLVGLGTWKADKESEVGNAVKWALEAGYRHLDCASCYQNEKEVGSAIQQCLATSVCRREELFVTSKLWNSEHAPEHVKPALQQTLSDLQLEYVDLYLIHWPQNWEHVDGGDPLPHMSFPKNADGSLKYSNIPLMDTWRALEACVEDGLVRNIGLSNFNEKQIRHILDQCSIKPAVLQVEIHPFFCDERLINFSHMHEIAVTAYSPLANGAAINGTKVIEHPLLIDIAQKYGKSPAQLVSAWLIQQNVIVIPKSVNQSRIVENFDVIFQISGEDMKAINSLTKANARMGWGGPLVEDNGFKAPRDESHPEYPFVYDCI